MRGRPQDNHAILCSGHGSFLECVNDEEVIWLPEAVSDRVDHSRSPCSSAPPGSSAAMIRGAHCRGFLGKVETAPGGMLPDHRLSCRPVAREVVRWTGCSMRSPGQSNAGSGPSSNTDSMDCVTANEADVLARSRRTNGRHWSVICVAIRMTSAWRPTCRMANCCPSTCGVNTA